MKTNLFRQVLIIGSLLAAASACSAAIDPTPCTVGNRWEHDCIKLQRGKLVYQGQAVADMYETASGTAVYEVTSADTSGATPVYGYRETTTTKSSINGRQVVEKSDMKVISDNQTMKILSTEQTITGEPKPEVVSYDPPLMYFMKDASPGKTWDVGVLKGGDSQEPLSAKIIGRESVTVPAGTFKDCVKVVYITDTSAGSVEIMGQKFTITSGKSRGVYWIADGVGVVKGLEVSTSTAQAPGPAGGYVTLEGGSCTITELKPGYIVK